MGDLGDFVETLRPRCAGSVANVHFERLAAAWANKALVNFLEVRVINKVCEFVFDIHGSACVHSV
jgi:hypothetical protein